MFEQIIDNLIIIVLPVKGSTHKNKKERKNKIEYKRIYWNRKREWNSRLQV